MGATPELIDLLIRHDAAASHSEMCATARSFAAEEWRCVEWLAGDWCEPVTRLRGGLDCVCCDGGTLFRRVADGRSRGIPEMVSIAPCRALPGCPARRRAWTQNPPLTACGKRGDPPAALSKAPTRWCRAYASARRNLDSAAASTGGLDLMPIHRLDGLGPLLSSRIEASVSRE